MKSMTGYGWREQASGDTVISVEIKSYNSRFLDLSVNIPYWLGRLENRVREFISSRVQRGKVELSIRIKEKNANLTVLPDTDAARSYMQAVMEIADALGHTGEIPLSLIIAQEGVLRSERVMDVESYWKVLEPVLTEAFTEFENFRETEGRALLADLTAMIDRIAADTELIAAKIPEMETMFRDTIRKRFEEVAGNAIDEQRVLQETAALLVRYTINEEIVRLRAHLDSLRKELQINPAPGRKADFICQEMNREINTIGSKNQILEVGQAVIDAKDALENIREQMRNIE